MYRALLSTAVRSVFDSVSMFGIVTMLYGPKSSVSTAASHGNLVSKWSRTLNHRSFQWWFEQQNYLFGSLSLSTSKGPESYVNSRFSIQFIRVQASSGEGGVNLISTRL